MAPGPRVPGVRSEERSNVIQESVRVAVCPTVLGALTPPASTSDYGQWPEYVMPRAQESSVPMMLFKHFGTGSQMEVERRD